MGTFNSPDPDIFLHYTTLPPTLGLCTTANVSVTWFCCGWPQASPDHRVRNINGNKPKPPSNQAKTWSSDHLSKPLKGQNKEERNPLALLHILISVWQEADAPQENGSHGISSLGETKEPFHARVPVWCPD